MEEDIKQIITQENVSLSQLNDEELSDFSEHIYNILIQFHEDLLVEDFILMFNEVAYNIIENEQLDESISEDEFTDSLHNIDIEYYHHLNKMESFYKECIQEIHNAKKIMAPTRVKILQQKIQPEQRSQEWYDMRYNMLTASDVGAILGMSKYNNKTKILRKKLGLSKFSGNKFTRHGTCYEPIATSIYENRFNTDVIEFGLIQHETIPFIGASPDGITPFGIMIEIKCPMTRKINGNVKDPSTLMYWAQIQQQLEVCDLDECHFWECKIEEYDNLQEYLDDKFVPKNIQSMNIIPFQNRPLNYIKLPPCRRSSNGQEKGIVIKAKKYNDDDDVYLYPPFNDTTEKQLQWVETQKSSAYQYFNIYYWKITLTSNCIVKRDKKWFQESIPKLQEFWQEVLFRRKNNLIEDIRPKTKSKMNIFDMSNISLPLKTTETCIIDCSSDEEYKTQPKKNKKKKIKKQKSKSVLDLSITNSQKGCLIDCSSDEN
jgi:putative phage-type endonuclease